MFNWPFTKKTCGNRLFGLLLILSLLSAALHLAMHDIDGAGGGPVGHQECQLNHLPCTQLSLRLLELPLPALMLLPAVLYVQCFHPVFSYLWLARAPPLF